MNFTHIDHEGNAVMVDVSQKASTVRTASACGRIRMSLECFQAIEAGTSKKGDVLGTAQIAGIMGAKQTADLIPLCHRLNLSKAAVTFRLLPELPGVEAVCTVKCTGQTGVEMEALTGVTTALLTIYDMCKAIDKRMVMENIHLEEKHGGKSGDFTFEDCPGNSGMEAFHA
ncbi:MAG: cyclic pyranopterin monophosphate synthase MoaC [Clostridium sp.]|nr:cyclic pyranopterin monophosphate synthase MoaC [Clostridium sp.]